MANKSETSSPELEHSPYAKTGSSIEKFNCSHPDLLHPQEDKKIPSYLWLGCSDFRVPETRLVPQQPPGTVFVHRNIANIVSSIDPSVQAVLEHATTLPVKSVVVCGHTDCGGVKAALDVKWNGETLERWLVPLRELRNKYREEIDRLPSERRADKLAELNVKAGVEVVKERKGSGWEVFGAMYDVKTGVFRRL